MRVDGSDRRIRVRRLDASGLVLQVRPAEIAIALARIPYETFFRRVGLGRLRKDMSTPLAPPSDAARIDETSDGATLKLNAAGIELRVDLGPLGHTNRAVADAFGFIHLLILVNDLDHPDLSIHGLIVERDAQRAWGGTVETFLA